MFSTIDSSLEDWRVTPLELSYFVKDSSEFEVKFLDSETWGPQNNNILAKTRYTSINVFIHIALLYYSLAIAAMLLDPRRAWKPGQWNRAKEHFNNYQIFFR